MRGKFLQIYLNCYMDMLYMSVGVFWCRKSIPVISFCLKCMVLSELTNYGRLKAYARPIKGIHSSDTLSLYQHIPFVHQFPPLTLLPLPCLHLTYTFLLLAFPRSQPLLPNRNASTGLHPFPSVCRLWLQPCLHPMPLLRSPLTVHGQGFSSVQRSAP